LRELQQAQRQLRSAELKDDQGESHFHALRHMVALLRDASDRKKTVGARELLDPRYRLQFSVSMIGRDTGEIIETRTGSQGGSGGEKEIIASIASTIGVGYRRWRSVGRRGIRAPAAALARNRLPLPSTDSAAALSH
jgi:uncharacterized protein YPO0396